MSIFDQEIMARTAIGEARGEGDEAMQAVMWTGMNRYTSHRWFGALTIAGTFLKPLQYSCWRMEDANYELIINITDAVGLFASSLKWAAMVISGMIPDPVCGATHYHDDSIAPPEWTKGATLVRKIGRLTFYKDVQ